MMRLSFMSKYIPVSQKDVVDGSQDLEEGESSSSLDYGTREKQFALLAKTPKLSIWTRWIPWLLCPCLFVSNTYTWVKLNRSVFNDAVYSPANVALQYKNVRWEAAIQDDMTDFQGVPNVKNNKLWDDLFNAHGITQITTSEARQLHNRTSPIDNKGNYAVTLDIFHQLHCLNKIRQKIYWNTTNYGSPEPDYINTPHVDHCIDQLRQSLMCSADVTPIPYQWYEKYHAYMPATGIVHTCRDFGAVQEWAKGRPKGEWDTEKRLVDPLGDVLHVYREEWCEVNGGCEWSKEADHHNAHAAHDHGMKHADG